MIRPNLKYDTTGDLHLAKLRRTHADLDAACRRDNYLFVAVLIGIGLLLLLVLEWVGR